MGGTYEIFIFFFSLAMQSELFDPRVKKLEEFKSHLAALEGKLEKDLDVQVIYFFFLDLVYFEREILPQFAVNFKKSLI